MSESDATPSDTSEADQTVDVRLAGGMVITMDGDFQVIDGGYLEVAGSRIVHVGAKPSKKCRPREHLDLTGKLVIPGLINTHCHLSQQLARGLADDVDLLTWLRARIWPYETALTPAEVELSALACCARADPQRRDHRGRPRWPARRRSRARPRSSWDPRLSGPQHP